MAVSELLRLVIDADTSGAVRAIDDLGNASKRELSKSEQSIQKWGNRLTNVGAGMVAIGAVGVVGLARAAQASEEAHLSVVKLENTLKNMPQLAGESSQQFIDLADSIQDVTAADADQIVAAEAMLGTFKLTAGEIKQLTPLVVDYARKFGVDLVDAATQVGKAVDGQVGALKRNGVSIDEAAFAADRFSAVQAALSEQVGGFAEAEGKTFAGSVERMKNELGDLAEGVGTGAVDAFSSMFGVIDGVTSRLNELSPSTQNAIGKFATFGSVGLIAAGGLSVLIGQTLKAVQNFKAAGDAISAFSTRVGGLSGLASGLTVIAPLTIAAAIAMKAYSDTQAEAAQRTNELVDAMKEEAEGMKGATEAAVRRGLAESEVGNILRKTRADYDVLIEGLRNEEEAIEALDDSWESITKGHESVAEVLDRAGVKSSKFTDELIRLIETEDLSSGEIKDLIDGLDQESDRLDDAESKTRDLSAASQEGAEAMAGFGEETDEATTALSDYRDMIAALTDPIFAAQDAITGVRDAQVGLAEAELGVLEAQVALDEAIKEHGRNSEEAAEAARDLDDAHRGLEDAQFATVRSAAEADQALAGLKEAVDSGDVSMADFQRTLRNWVEQGFLTEQQAAQAAFAVGGLAGQAEAADDKRVTIPVTTPGLFAAVGAFDSLAARINSLPGNVRVSVGGGGGLILHEGGIVPGQRGQEVAAILQAGEEVLALNDPRNSANARPLGPGGGGGTYIDQRQITIQTGSDPQQVVEALKRYERSNGPLPVSIR